MPSTVERLSAAFDPRANGLNLFRLLLAASVIVTHSYPVTGHEEEWQFLRGAGVDGFFAISGFLIAGSWARRTSTAAYLQARLLRILPGLWVCLLVTAVVIAPLATMLSGEALPDGYVGGALEYFSKNFLMQDQGQSIPGTLDHVPYPNAWNSSLWTLRWEFLCYLGVMALGVAGIVARRWFIGLLFIALTFAQAVVVVAEIDHYWVQSPVRFALMFVAGMLLFVLRDRVPVTRGLVSLSAAIVMIISTLFPGADYRIVASVLYGYALIAGSTFVRSPTLQLRNDISYGTYIYGFPVQQLLASTRAVEWNPLVFAVVAIVATLPLAVASWFLVEKPAQRLRGKLSWGSLAALDRPPAASRRR